MVLPQKPNLVHASSKASLLSSESSSSYITMKDKKRRVSFDLLAEMVYAFPEQTLSPILVEVPGSEEEEEVQELEGICDGSSTSGSESGGDDNGDGGDGGVEDGEGWGDGKEEAESGTSHATNKRPRTVKQNVIYRCYCVSISFYVIFLTFLP